VYAAARIDTVRLGPILPSLMPSILRMPNALYGLVSKGTKVSAIARSSMQDDLREGRKTEIDHLNGEIIRIGKAHGIGTPVIETLMTLVRKAEHDGAQPSYSPTEACTTYW
jgi:2-dehydropantoate 2-reductase